MADIFISYAKKDREKVEPIALALMEQGWSVFWDRAIPGGKTWDEVIEEELDAAKCVVVVWSKISIKSRWVRAEAEEGLHRNILVPVSIEDVKIPLLFRPIQSVRLIHWQGDSNHPQFVKFTSDLSPILGPSPKKVKEAEKLRAEEERRRKQEEEQKRKAEVDKRRNEQEEQERKAAEEKRRKEQELKRKAEEERLKKEAEAKRKADEKQNRKDSEAWVKKEKPEPDANATIKSVSSEPAGIRGKALKISAAVVVVVLLFVGILLWISRQPVNEVRNELEKLDRQALELENAVSELNKADQIEEFTRQKDTLNSQVAGIWPDWYPVLATFRKSDTRKATWQLINTIVPYCGLCYLMIRSIQLDYSSNSD